MTEAQINKLTKTTKWKYRVFSCGFVFSELAVAVALGMINPYLGAACFFAELTYFNYINMITQGNLRNRLNAAEAYTKQLVSPDAKVEDKAIGGQYL